MEKADSVLNIEVIPDHLDKDNFVLLLSFGRIPIYKNYEYGVMLNDLQWNSERGNFKKRALFLCLLKVKIINMFFFLQQSFTVGTSMCLKSKTELEIGILVS